MPFDAIIKKFRIPFSTNEIASPKGAGAKVYSDLANEKIGKVIERKKNVKAKIGILVANPETKETQHPIAIICEFTKSVTQDIVDLAHKLCWNFCRSQLLIVIEPTLVRVFSCYQKPIQSTRDSSLLQFEESSQDAFSAPTPIYEFQIESDSQETKSAIKALQWIELVSGNFFNEEIHKKYFPREQRADKTLLANLSSIRRQLKEKGLEYDTIHDLLARFIFIQFLFQREDSQGVSAISPVYLANLCERGELSGKHSSLEEIFSSYDDTYKFFRLLNKKFNGDLFPGDNDEDWQEEMRKVRPEHLKLLAEFISGDIQLDNGQYSFWRMYSFDTIPLEFISSIYEEFVSQQQHQQKDGESTNNIKREKGVFYTKSHLVDFMLDNVLPWDEIEWDLKILDPSCGSGIFLVKAFQRLVHRWENSLSKTEKNSAEFSKKKKEKVIELLKNNLFGVDIDEHAVRVASFSLYLALCDELDPKTLWEEVKFPNLREKQVVKKDFFYEEKPLFKENPDIKYDLIIGNAPWGNKTLKVSEEAQSWAKKNKWIVSNNNIGTLFLPRAAELIKDNGYISLIQPLLPLLTSKLATSEEFRSRLFKEFEVEEIVNLSDLRPFLFENAGYPSCVVTMRSFCPDNSPIQYICPKKRGVEQEDYTQIFIEPMDISFVFPNEAINEPWIWTTLFLGVEFHKIVDAK
jgi:type I restriction-modification system DNA methylase subunit